MFGFYVTKLCEMGLRQHLFALLALSYLPKYCTIR